MINPKRLIPVFFIIACSSFAQDDTLNRMDPAGLKQGYWIIYGKDVPEKGYPPDGKVEEGYYKDGRKNGEWKMYHPDGKTIRLVGNFENGRPEGSYRKYSYEGLLLENGSFNRGKQSGELIVYYESGCIKSHRFFDAEGKEDSTCCYYYDNCDLSESTFGQIEHRYIANNGIKTNEEFFNKDGTVKQKDPGPEGFVSKPVPLDVISYTEPTGGPCGESGTTKNGQAFDPDGYNKVYNYEDELWMDGEFKSCKLWNGKWYKYDDNGILIKVELWKDGAFCCDAQL